MVVPGCVPGNEEDEAGAASSTLYKKLLKGYWYSSLYARVEMLDGCGRLHQQENQCLTVGLITDLKPTAVEELLDHGESALIANVVNTDSHLSLITVRVRIQGDE